MAGDKHIKSCLAIFFLSGFLNAFPQLYIADSIPDGTITATGDSVLPSALPPPISTNSQPDNLIQPVDFIRLISHPGDSSLYLPYPRSEENGWYRRSNGFYDSLKIKAEGKRFTRELYKALFRDTLSRTRKEKVLDPELFRIYENKIIRSLTLKTLDVFGPAIEDTALRADAFIRRLGNNLHIKTRQRIIRQSLLIKEGERLNPFVVFENERLIRDLPYIKDARFLISQPYVGSDSVDVILIVQDVWPIGFGTELTGFDAGNASLWHTNMLGLGHQFQPTIYWDARKSPFMATSFLYSIASIGGSYITADINYINRWTTETYRLDLYRNFIATGINWAGALRLEKTDKRMNVALRDTTLDDIPLHYQWHDFWLGHLFPLRSRLGLFPTQTSFFVAGRYLHNHFTENPETSEDYLYRFHDKTQWLFSLGLSNQGFYRSSMIYSFGQTEDVPFGYLVKLTGGFEQGLYNTRPYFGLSASGGINLRRLGYTYLLAEAGSFFARQEAEQGTVHLLFRYFTGLQTIRRFNFRHFLTTEYVLGINRTRDEFVTLENRGGIQGLESRYLRGSEKALIRWETVMFTPYQLVGFHFAFFAFADIARISGTSFAVSNNKVYSGLGLGLRIRNERLVFNTLQLKFSWYPSLPEEAEYRLFNASGIPRLQMNNFYMDEPGIIEY